MGDELGDDTIISPIPTHHWSEIASPRLKNYGETLFFQPITITQNVHCNNQTPKTTKAHPALVIYDSDFVKYKLLGTIVPFFTDYFAKSDSQALDATIALIERDLLPYLLAQVVEAVITASKVHANAIKDCEEIGVTLDYDDSSILRSFKCATAKKYKASQVMNLAALS
jgi:hypothetical protein